MAFPSLIRHYLTPIESLLGSSQIADIFVDRWDLIYYSAGGTYHSTTLSWPDEASLLNAINQIANAAAGIMLSDATPMVDARLRDGSRVAASIPPLAPNPQMTIRVARPQQLTIADLLAFEMLSPEMADFLGQAIAAYKNIVVAGPMDSGKTTLLRTLVTPCVDRDRIYVVEDTAELRLPLRRGVQHEVDRNNRAKLTMGDSIRASLRHAPNRIVVGEIRDDDALKAYLEAIEAGLRGAITSMHADSAFGALHRAEMILMRRGNVNSLDAARYMVRSCVDIVVYCEKDRYDGKRRVTEIAAVSKGEPQMLWQWSGHAFIIDPAFAAALAE